MKHEKFAIVIKDESGDIKIKPVMGIRVVIPGYEELGFFAHHSSDSTGYDKNWTISEVSTGRHCMPKSRIGHLNNKTIKGAIELVTAYFNCLGKEQVLACILHTPKFESPE